jgi:hypothetical protein
MRGGAREGSGRKPKADEELVRNQSIEAITQLYGSVENGFKTLLRSGEASLIKFVWEHAVGKPKEKVELSGEMGITWHEERTYEKPGPSETKNESL